MITPQKNRNKNSLENSIILIALANRHKPARIFFVVVYLITLSIKRKFSPINLSLVKPVWSLEISTVEKF